MTRPAWTLGLLALAGAAGLFWHGPIAQLANYHDFADTRSWWGIPYTADVLSNLPFALVGVVAWRRLLLSFNPNHLGAARAWRLFAFAVACTAVGSSFYHWQPDDHALIFDRLPIAWACAALLCAFLAERVTPAAGGRGVLVFSLILSTASVMWWWWTGRDGPGDLRLYLFVQFLPLLLVPVGLGLGLKPLSEHGVPAWAWALALGLYVVAKLFELADHRVLNALGFLSGHTIKHLLASLAAGCLLWRASSSQRF